MRALLLSILLYSCTDDGCKECSITGEGVNDPSIVIATEPRVICGKDDINSFIEYNTGESEDANTGVPINITATCQ